MVAETLEHRSNQGHRSNLSIFRDARCIECDLLYAIGDAIAAIEIKPGRTVASDWFRALEHVAHAFSRIVATSVVCGGTDRQVGAGGEIARVSNLARLLGRFESARDV